MSEKIYLAGPIQHVQDYGRGWRQWLKANNDTFAWQDPMDEYDSVADAEREWTDEEIVEKDLSMIDNSAGLLVHWPRHRSVRPAFQSETGERTCKQCGEKYSALSMHYLKSECEYPSVPSNQKEAVIGMVMSDGHVGNRAGASRLDVQMTNAAALEEFADTIESLHPQVWETGKTTDAGKDMYRLLTIGHPWLNALDHWYKDDGKTYPDDINLTPTIAKWWYVGDGSLIWNKKAAHGYVQISCVNEKNNTEKIQKLLSEFDPTIYSSGEIALNTKNSKKFLDYIGEPVRGMEYKWEINNIELYQRKKPFAPVSTVGTPMEIFYTQQVLDKPVAVQTKIPEERLSPWLTYHADTIAETFDEALSELDSYV